MFSFKSSGSFDKTEAWLKKIGENSLLSALDRYGQMGADALARATPVESGVTARSWTYEIIKTRDEYSIIWSNTNVQDGRPIAVLIQYGHGTGTGGYVQGQDYINPALRPIFDQMAAEGWKVVSTA